jgi:chromosomal replication initiation ATPase DnaA
VTQLLLDLGHVASLGRGDFRQGTSNAEAVAWIDRWPDWPYPVLALAGPAGSGKSHLGEIWRRRSRAVPVAGPALDAAEAERLATGAAAVLVEQADQAPERPLLHLRNALVEQGRSLLLIAREPPARWGTALPDLASRLAIIPVARIEPPDDGLLAELLAKLFADRQLTVPDEIIAWLVARMERSFDGANRLAAAIDRLSLSQHRPITFKLVRDALQTDAMPGNQRPAG